MSNVIFIIFKINLSKAASIKCSYCTNSIINQHYLCTEVKYNCRCSNDTHIYVHGDHDEFVSTYTSYSFMAVNTLEWRSFNVFRILSLMSFSITHITLISYTD